MLTFSGDYLLAGLILIPYVLVVRFICVGTPIQIMRKVFAFDFAPHAVKILTWGGIRGASLWPGAVASAGTGT